MTDPNEPAFPVESGATNGTPYAGLSKREYFAAAALAGLVTDGVPKQDAPQFAVFVADALIDALNAKPQT